MLITFFIIFKIFSIMVLIALRRLLVIPFIASHTPDQSPLIKLVTSFIRFKITSSAVDITVAIISKAEDIMLTSSSLYLFQMPEENSIKVDMSSLTSSNTLEKVYLILVQVSLIKALISSLFLYSKINEAIRAVTRAITTPIGPVIVAIAALKIELAPPAAPIAVATLEKVPIKVPPTDITFPIAKVTGPIAAATNANFNINSFVEGESSLNFSIILVTDSMSFSIEGIALFTASNKVFPRGSSDTAILFFKIVNCSAASLVSK